MLTCRSPAGNSARGERSRRRFSCCCTPINQFLSTIDRSGVGRVTPALRPASSTLLRISLAAWSDPRVGLIRLREPVRSFCTVQFRPSVRSALAKFCCQGRLWPLRLLIRQLIARRSGPARSISALTRTHPLSNRVSPSRTVSTSTAKPADGAWVGPVGGGGGGVGFRRRLLLGLPFPMRGAMSSVGNCIDQRAGRSRLGASSTLSN